MKTRITFILICVFLLGACTTRSISNSGYQASGGGDGDNPFYQGELSEFDVLGIEAGKTASDEEIAEAFRNSEERINIRKGDAILLIQSGALIPDQEMINAMEPYFSVSVFSGVPEEGKADNASYSQSLRLAAARAGISTIMTYWGLLESGSKNLGTKTVSWFPVVGWAIPDESQEIRIRLKVAIVDVVSGRWEMFVPKVFEDQAYSSILSREQSDQQQVAQLKSLGYESAVNSVLDRYVR